MRDRFAEGSSAGGAIDSKDVTIEMNEVGDPSSGDEMKKFFAELSSIRNNISSMERNVEKIEELHGRVLTIISEEQSAQTSKELDKVIDETNSLATTVRNRLKEMNKNNDAFKSAHPTSGDARIRESQHASLSKKYVDILQKYQSVQSKYKGKYEDRVKRQILIVKPDATEEEVRKIMEEGNRALFAAEILPSSQHSEAQKALRDMEERHEDILKLERSIIELHQLFVDMAVLVDQQSSQINAIEEYVSKAVDHTEKGVQELIKANKLQKRSRKRMCCILVCTGILILILVLGITGGLKLFK